MKEYINCIHALRPTCPYRFHKFMTATLSGNEEKILTQEIIDSANSLCDDCDKFTPNPQK